MASTCVKTLLVGLSGPSSSGKTTLARLLRSVFTLEVSDGSAITATRPFILHEDDFYKSDDLIPVVTMPSGKAVQDWDTIGALDIGLLEAALVYVRDHGKLPAGLKSKEDLNDAADSGVHKRIVQSLRSEATQRLQKVFEDAATTVDMQQTRHLALALVEGFLLYAPPDQPSHPLRLVHDIIHIPLFLPATYTLLKERREKRTGYVTIGPAPTPSPQIEMTAIDVQSARYQEEKGANEYTPPDVNFWTDPPGYVDDIVWPRYITDHAWLLLPQDTKPDIDVEKLKQLIGEGRNAREDVGVLVAPGQGEASMEELLHWAVDEILKVAERLFTQ
ncbi:ribosylnicotinamide kinase [Ophidiomyces ophidiicola]|nr:ribosylnicotinamide kinase [Ophidiomyces ophidiicola]